MSTGDITLDERFHQIFEEFFNSGARPTGAVAVELVLTAAELRAGVVKSIEIAHPGECSVCEPARCRKCDGRGAIEQAQGIFVIQRACECAGGSVYDARCPACAGDGAARDVVEVTVPAGSEAGQVIVVAGEGDRIDGGRGDLLVHLAVAGIEVPRAAVHRPDRKAGLGWILALALGVAIFVSQLW